MEQDIITKSTFMQDNIKRSLAFVFIAMALVFGMSISQGSANAMRHSATSPVPLGTLADVSIFSSEPMCNSGDSLISGDVLVNTDSSSLLGIDLPLGINIDGLVNIANQVTAKAKVDLNAALNNAAGKTAVGLDANLSGKTLAPGVYAGTAINLNGTVTLDGKGDPNAVFILKTNGNLNVGSNSSVRLINKANSDRIFWIVGGKANIGAKVTFAGKLLSIGNVATGNNAKIHGALFSRDGAVCLDTSVVTTPAIIGADVEVGLPDLNTPAVDDPTGGGGDDDPTATTVPDVAGTIVNGADDNGQATGGRSSGNRTSSSGLLAFTGRNALVLTAVAMMLIGAGSAFYYNMKRKQLLVPDEE